MPCMTPRESCGLWWTAGLGQGFANESDGAEHRLYDTKDHAVFGGLLAWARVWPTKVMELSWLVARSQAGAITIKPKKLRAYTHAAINRMLSGMMLEPPPRLQGGGSMASLWGAEDFRYIHHTPTIETQFM